MSEVHLIRHDVLDSTQLEARRLLDAGTSPDLPFAVVADEQTAGRGRDGRAWASPPGGLWVTSVWPLTGPPDPLLGLRLGLAVRDALAEFLPDHASVLRLKWPNDIILDDRKLGGVLTETVSGRAAEHPQRAALVGVGVNVNVDRSALPEPIRRDAASMHEFTGTPVDPEPLLQRLFATCAQALNAPISNETLAAEVNQVLYRRSEHASLVRPDGSVAAGRLEGVDGRGEPILVDESGQRIAGRFTGFWTASRDRA